MVKNERAICCCGRNMKKHLLTLAAVVLTFPAYAQSTSLYSNSTSVGIGTSIPNSVLDIEGSSRLLTQIGGAQTVTDGSTQVGLIVQSTYEPTSSTLNDADIYLHPSFSPGSGITITNGVGLYITAGDQSGLGSVTNGYGLYVSPPSYGTNQYAAYFGGAVGISTTTPRGGSTLDVNGTLYVGSFASNSSTTVCQNGNVLSSCTSSRRYKENIAPSQLGLKEVLQMKPVTFDLMGHKNNWEKHDFGFIAEDMLKINPLFVIFDEDDEINGVRYMQLTAVNTKAIQELHGKEVKDVTQLQDEIDELRQTIEQLKHHR